MGVMYPLSIREKWPEVRWSAQETTLEVTTCFTKKHSDLPVSQPLLDGQRPAFLQEQLVKERVGVSARPATSGQRATGSSLPSVPVPPPPTSLVSKSCLYPLCLKAPRSHRLSTAS